MRPGNCKQAEDVSSSACPQFRRMSEGLGSNDSRLKGGKLKAEGEKRKKVWELSW